MFKLKNIISFMYDLSYFYLAYKNIITKDKNKSQTYIKVSLNKLKRILLAKHSVIYDPHEQ